MHDHEPTQGQICGDAADPIEWCGKAGIVDLHDCQQKNGQVDVLERRPNFWQFNEEIDGF